jgi:transposase
MKVTTLGIDLAKSIFQLHGVDARGTVVLGRQTHPQITAAFSRGVLVMSDRHGSVRGHSFFAREIEKLGHTVRLMSPHFVTAVSQEPEERRQRCREICDEAVARHIELFYADKYRRLNRMRILDKIRSSRQLHICLLDDLARSAGRCETLAINLRRHAEQCGSPLSRSD